MALATDGKLPDFLIGAREKKTILNVRKIKEIIIDFRQKKPNYTSIMVDGEVV